MNEHGVQRLATFGHGVGATVNLFGVVFNRIVAGTWKDRDVIIHALGFGYHTFSALQHRKRQNDFASGPRTHDLGSSRS